MKVQRPYAHCCPEGGGSVEHCDCVKKDHGTAWYDVPDPTAPAKAAPMREDVMQSQDLDLSWLDICVTGSPGDEIIVAHSFGWSEMNLAKPYLCDNVEFYDAPETPGLYRWADYTLGCWDEDEPMVIKGGTWTPYRLARAPRPAPPANE